MSNPTGWRALFVPVEGEIREVTISPEGSGLRDLRRLTGSHYVESTGVPGIDCNFDAWLDEEGAIADPPRPINRRLTFAAARSDNWPLRGDAVITGAPSPDGDITSLRDVDVEGLRIVMGGVR